MERNLQSVWLEGNGWQVPKDQARSQRSQDDSQEWKIKSERHSTNEEEKDWQAADPLPFGTSPKEELAID
jgi:hypothetical protein